MRRPWPSSVSGMAMPMSCGVPWWPLGCWIQMVGRSWCMAGWRGMGRCSAAGSAISPISVTPITDAHRRRIWSVLEAYWRRIWSALETHRMWEVEERDEREYIPAPAPARDGPVLPIQSWEADPYFAAGSQPDYSPSFLDLCRAFGGPPLRQAEAFRHYRAAVNAGSFAEAEVLAAAKEYAAYRERTRSNSMSLM